MMTLEQRCKLATDCLPQAEYRTRLEALHAELLALAERMRSWLEGDCYCPCCAESRECADDCTFASDCPEHAERMAGAREAVFGAERRSNLPATRGPQEPR